MRTIKISEDVWSKIAEKGKFGETEDDVLRRVFEIEPAPPEERTIMRTPRRNYSTKKMHAGVHENHLQVSFETGENRRWPLPEKSDKEGIRKVRNEATDWAREQGASDPGQTNAVRKALTDAGYHLTK